MALVKAAKEGDIARVKEEIAKGTDLNQRDEDDFRRETGLHYAARNGSQEILEALVAAGADIHAGSSTGSSCLHYAAVEGQLHTLQVLLTAGADPHIQNKEGWTPLHVASLNGHSECVVALVRGGAQLDTEDKNGRTPLCYAASESNPSTAKLLLSLGADPNHSSIEWALKRARKDVVGLIKKAKEKGRAKPTAAEREQILNRIYPRIVTFSKHNVEEIHTTPKQRGNLSRTKSLDIMSAGGQGFGKTTFVKTVIASKPCLTKESDRTVVANFSLWVPDGEKSQTIVVVDVGGHDSYKVTGHYFHINSTNNLVLLCHDLTEPNYDETLEWIDMIWCSSPDSNIHIILTKADLVGKSEQEQKKEAFFEKLSEFVEEQLEMIATSVQNERFDGDEDYRKNMEVTRQKYRELLDNKESHTHIVSCCDGYQESVEAVKSCILKYADQNQIQLPETLHLLFERLGRVGLDVPQIELTDKEFIVTRESLWQKISKPLKALRPKIKNKKSKSSTIERSHTATGSQTELSLTPADQSSIEKTQYATLEQAKEIYRDILEQLKQPTEAIEVKTKDAVSQLSKQRLLIYFPDNERLSEIIFNDLKSFTNILRCVFHHALDSFLNYDPKDKFIKKHYTINPENQFQRDVYQLKQEGLITEPLIGYLLSKHNCGIGASTVMELLDRVDVGTKLQPVGDENEPVAFIPFFISHKDIKELDLKMFQDIEHSDKDHLSMTLVLHGNIQMSYWHYLVAQLHQKTYLHRVGQKRQVSRNGFYVTIGEHNAKVALTMPEKKMIKLVVKACIIEEGGHRLIFSFLKDFSKGANDGKKKWWRGLPEIQILLCTHCDLELEIEKKLGIRTGRKPEEWCTPQIFKSGMENQEHIFCQETQIPAALIHPLSEDEPRKRRQLFDLQEYLHKHSINVKAAQSQATLHGPVPRGQTRSDSQGPNPHVAFKTPTQAPVRSGVLSSPVAPGDTEEAVVSEVPPLAPAPVVRPKQAVIGNEIFKVYQQNHKLFDKEGYFLPVVSEQCCRAIADKTLQDPKFALSRVDHQVVAFFPEIILESKLKEQINAGTLSLHQALVNREEPQKVRHFLVFLFHHQLPLYREMEGIHGQHTRRHIRKCAQCKEIVLEEKPGHDLEAVGLTQSKSTSQSKYLLDLEVPDIQGTLGENHLAQDITQTTQKCRTQDVQPVLPKCHIQDVLPVPHSTRQQEDLHSEITGRTHSPEHDTKSRDLKQRPSTRTKTTPVIPVGFEPLDRSSLKIDRNLTLGKGNYGYVYKGIMKSTEVAVKELVLPKKRTVEVTQSLLNEIQISAFVHHPSIVQFLGYCYDNDSKCCLVVYELINGHNLEEVLYEEEVKQAYQFTISKRYRVLLQTCQALAYLHSQNPQIIHGDVKPANVMVNKAGHAKLCDLGFSKYKQGNPSTLASTVSPHGTPIYMAPEQLLHKKTSSAMSDVYAFGALMYEVLFEQLLWDLDNYDDCEQLVEKMKTEQIPYKLKNITANPVHAVITKCVQFQYDRRPQSIEVRQDLDHLYNMEVNGT